MNLLYQKKYFSDNNFSSLLYNTPNITTQQISQYYT